MPHLITIMGRGYVKVRIEYEVEFSSDDPSIEILKVSSYSPVSPFMTSTMDIADVLTDESFQALEEECKLHAIAQAKQEQAEPVEPT